jgi:magnesium transporter
MTATPPAIFPRARPDSAGGLMTRQVATIPVGITIGQAVEEIRRIGARPANTPRDVYALDPRGRLAGTVSMRALVLSPPGAPLARAIEPRWFSVPANTDREEAARLMQRHDLLALPVLDDHGRLVGAITIEQALAVIADEATEDVQRLFGAGAQERLDSPWHFSFRGRIGWLVANLGLASVGAAVVGAFEETIRSLVVLTVYLPVVAGMGGNAAAQAMAVMIRGLATGRVDGRSFRRVAARECRVGLATGAVTGVIAAAVAWACHVDHGLGLGLLVAPALAINQTIGCLWGATIPYVMWRLGKDPAQSATIFTTTLTDLLGFLTLLGLAARWLR